MTHDMLHSLVWFGLVWFGLVWFGLVWFGLVWFGLVWFGLVWFGLFAWVLWSSWLAGSHFSGDVHVSISQSHTGTLSIGCAVHERRMKSDDRPHHVSRSHGMCVIEPRLCREVSLRMPVLSFVMWS